MDKKLLKRLYLKEKLSAFQIAKQLNYSEHKVNYWIAKHGIVKRTISDATYQRWNPDGDPFSFSVPKSRDMFLFGLGLGLFWGEGTKRDLGTVKICNTDPAMVKKFIEFLVHIYRIDKKKLKFNLQIYDDLNIEELMTFWTKHLSVQTDQFSKTTILKRRGKGTYLHKMKHGVMIVMFNNKKLRNLICSQIANL